MAVWTLAWNDPLPAACRGGAVSVGNFDGVHRGHQAILAQLKRQAQGGPAVVLTFDPHPLQILRPEQFQPVLTTIGQRAELFHRYGADQVIVLPTSAALLHLTAGEFFDQVLRQRLDARTIVEGLNFCFGRDRQGTVATLQALAAPAQVQVVLVPSQEWEGLAISSSRVRRELVQGQVQAAAQLLGRPYQITGTVGQGQRRGQKLGFPTANLEAIATLVPGDGVYAVRVTYQGKTYPGAANLGPNPTFGEQTRKVEVHLIGFQGDLYGQVLTLDFIERLRDTRPFAGVEDLVQQLVKDVARTRELFGS